MPHKKPPAYQFPERSGPKEVGTPFRRIVVVQLIPLSLSDLEVEDQYEEICRLVETLEGVVVGREMQRRDHPHKEYCVGSGKAEEIGALCDQTEADTVVFDGKLNPTQISNLEYETGSHVMDRTELILEIFARRAKTAEAKIQVELAYLDYVHPRMNQTQVLRAKRGGLRGFGESPLSKRLRAGKERASNLRKQLKKFEGQKESRIKRRADIPTIALVGYTNAGKSTLLNSLAGEKLYADDRLFATLDTTTRRVHLGNQKMALFSDTVGFVRRLPHQLVSSFRSTLMEALESDLMLHVADASSHNLRHQMEAVDTTLAELGAANKPCLIVFNKSDLAEEETRITLHERFPASLFISAKTGEGLDGLRKQILERIEEICKTIPPMENPDPEES